MDFENLDGVDLDFQVAIARGLKPAIETRHFPKMAAHASEAKPTCVVYGWKILGALPYQPSRDRDLAGQIIEEHRIEVSPMLFGDGWIGRMFGPDRDSSTAKWCKGPTPCVAAMRVFVLVANSAP